MSRPGAFYGGAQVGVPLFWGDLRSAGDKLQLGYGGGLLAGYRMTDWLAAELDAGYMAGKLGAADWQLDDRMDASGMIRYTAGDYALGDVYSKTRLFRVGLRAPVQLLRLFGRRGRFQIEIAPHIYLNSFSTGIHDRQTDDELTEGVSPRSWSYTAGSDLGFSYRTGQRSRIFLRSALSWIYDDRFEGVSTHPAWRENFMLYTSVGISFDLGKARKAKRHNSKPTPVASTVPAQPVTPAPVEKASEETPAPATEKPEPPAAAPATESETTTTVQPAAAPYDWIAPIYFNRNSATVDTVRYRELLQHILRLADEYRELSIQIKGWTDTTGTEAGNEKLSQQRAQALADYLIGQGADSNRIQVQGEGEDHAAGDGAEGRRVEVMMASQ